MNEIFTVEDLAQRLGLSAKTIYRNVRRGILRGHKIGRVLRFTDNELSDFLNRTRTNV